MAEVDVARNGALARSGRHRVSAALLGVAIVVAALLVRLQELDRFVTPDELKWTCRSINFYRALKAHDWAGTLQTGHPGVLTMWLGAPLMGADADDAWLDACANPSLADLIETHPPGTAGRLASLLYAARRGVAVLTALVIGLAYLMLVRLLGLDVAVVAGLALAFDPFYLAHSRLLHLDAFIASLLFLSVLCLALGISGRSGRGRAYLVASGVLGGLAALNKSPAMVYAPFVVAWLVANGLSRHLGWKRIMPTDRRRPASTDSIVVAVATGSEKEVRRRPDRELA